MENLGLLLHGLEVAISPLNLLYCLIGVSLGTLIGVLPGVGPTATISILLPITFSLGPVSALIMLAGIYYGAQYGGSTTAILVNLPGESSSVVTCLDGYQMARQGRAGPALAIAAIGSFFAGTVATFVIAFFAPPIAALALKFSPADYFSLMVLGLIAAIVLAHGSPLKAVAMAVLGLLFGIVGTDVNSGVYRLTFGVPELFDGIDFLVVAMGLFAFTEVLAQLSSPAQQRTLIRSVKGLMPARADLSASWKPAVRGTVLGSLLGVLPGGGALLSSFASYALEKNLAVEPERFGRGAVEGVAGPESANNAGAQTSFIPMLTLGIPSNSVMALMIGAMMIQGIAPGPQVMTSNPELFWGLIASMWIGNALLVLLNLPLVGLWVKLMSVPYRILFPAILVFSCIGLYSVNSRAFDVGFAAVFGLLGYLFHKLKCEPAPLILGFILGPMMEENFRRAMLLSRGDPVVFVTSPMSASLLLLSFLLLAVLLAPWVRKRREEVFAE